MSIDPLIGQQLANYRLERVLGRGGMAVVYYATDIALRRPAAVKVIDTRYRGSSAYAERFIAEARSVATWRHEHILQVYYAGEAHEPGLEGLLFFAMEYIEGQDLGAVLADCKARDEYLPLSEVLRYGRAIAGALDYAHARGVIHRDVKPSNVLVSREGRIVLGDFGLSMDVQQGSFGEVLGSPQYTAPEQARRSNAAVPQSDLYSLGVMLYEMLTGLVPFDDPSPTSVALQHLTQPVPPPAQYRADMTPAVETVLLRALAKDPAQRYPSGAALMQDLENALREMSPALPTVQSLPRRPDGLAGTGDHSATNPARSSRSLSWKPLALITGGLGCGVLVVLAAMLVAFRLVRPPNLPGFTGAMTQTASVQLAGSTAIPGVQEGPTPVGTITSSIAITATPKAQQMTPTGESGDQPGAPTPTWTPRYASGRRMLLFWDETSFYMLQVTGFGELIDPLVFERLDVNGTGQERFSGKLWAEYSPASLRDWCYRLEISGPEGQFLRPAQCKNQYVATRWPQPGEPTIFWTQKAGSTTFRVLWGRDEIQRCVISAGTCEVYLP